MFDIIKPILKPKVSGVALGDLLSIAENLLSIANSMLLTLLRGSCDLASAETRT